MNEYNVIVRRGLALAGLVALPLVLAGCFPSASDGGSSASGDEVVPLGAKAAAMDKWMDGVPTVNWGAAATLKAFRPGQASYEYLSSVKHTGGITADCTQCHGGYPTRPPFDSAVVDEEIPVPDVNTVDINVQAAYDATNFYLKASWRTPRPGITHGISTYQSGAWVVNSTAMEPSTIPLPDGKVYAAEDRLGVMFMPASRDISTGGSFHRAGCFVTCHDDMDDMPDALGGDKYLVSSTAGSRSYSVGTETNAEVTAGTVTGFPDMWHWRGGRAAAVQTLTDGFVMATRASDAGANPWATNTAAAGNYMYDDVWMAAYITANYPDYTGEKAVNAFPAALWDDELDNAPALILDGVNANAEAFDTGVVFAEGDILPRIRLTSLATGSRNDVKTYSSWQDGTYTVIFQRLRDTGVYDDHVLNPDVENYSFAFSVFQSHTQHRWHHVTFPVTLGIEGGNAIIKAKLN